DHADARSGFRGSEIDVRRECFVEIRRELFVKSGLRDRVSHVAADGERLRDAFVCDHEIELLRLEVALVVLARLPDFAGRRRKLESDDTRVSTGPPKLVGRRAAI